MKEKIKKFIIYTKEYNKINIIFFAVAMASVAMMDSNSHFLKNLASCIMLLLPLTLPLFIEDKDNSAENKDARALAKRYILKYLKTFAVFLIFLIAAGIFVMISSFSLDLIRIDRMGITLGSLILFIIIAFIGIEGCKILISDLPASLVFTVRYDYGVWKSVRFGRAFIKQNLFDYIFSIASAGLLFIPILMLSATIQNHFVSTMLKLLYLMIWCEYVTFDIKERMELFLKGEDVTKNNRWKTRSFFNKKSE